MPRRGGHKQNRVPGRSNPTKASVNDKTPGWAVDLMEAMELGHLVPVPRVWRFPSKKRIKHSKRTDAAVEHDRKYRNQKRKPKLNHRKGRR